MGLVTLEEVMKIHDGAVGAFSTYDLYSAQGIINAAEEKGLPVIAMIGSPVLNKLGNEELGEIMVNLAKKSSAPVCVFLDHSKDLATCIKAIRLGFSAVMIDGSHLSLEENIEVTNKVTEVARGVGVSVEAELGALAGIEDGEEVKNAKMTDPTHVDKFLSSTDVDALAVSIGNAHGLYKGEPKLDFERLQKIADIANVPLVLHGGTGLTVEQFAKGVSMGIKKINIGTEVKKTYIDAFIETSKVNPAAHDMVGIPLACKDAVKEMVKDKLEFFARGYKELL
ncbi:fructose-bisphosphate aldolase class II [Desulfitispora alkaliphila]|uniref:class II fructose-bisphosphate aldolase n=1 Tax=Desulfitispora alkaliphila TaxID=622674 RepID=UPI003D1EE57E